MERDCGAGEARDRGAPWPACSPCGGETEVGATGKSSVARSSPPGGAAQGPAGNGVVAIIVGLALRFALGAPPLGLRRAALRSQANDNNNKNKTPRRGHF